MRTMIAIAVAAAAGCGGSSKPEVADPCADPCKGKMEGHHEGEHGDDHHPELTPEMTAFHDVLAPLWHAPVGPDREVKTCEASRGMLDLGADIQDAPAPEGVDPAAWQPAMTTFMLSITDLMDTCSGTGKDGMTFDVAFTGVHDGFHGLMDQLPK